jgi:enterochelin esterase family protein
VGEVLQGKGPQAMTKGADGVWSVTVGPLPPEIWIYNFRIQGVDLPDPANISVMPRAAGTANSSFVEVPGDGPAFYDARPCRTATVRMVLYESKATGVHRYLWVYTPPGYDASGREVPGVLPAARQRRDAEWMGGQRPREHHSRQPDCRPPSRTDGGGHAARPPDSERLSGTVRAGAAGREPGMLNFRLFTRDLLQQIIPLVERSYRVYSDAEHRAIGGLSMGGFRASRSASPSGAVPLRARIQRWVRVARIAGAGGGRRDAVTVEGAARQSRRDQEYLRLPLSR